ncbi:MAG: hypothetical protein N2578_05270 [Bdellovibrionaceae bacterium]|nr:hypothetical protein [Pseudobdellovibrionaceae bacterium]
MLLSVAFFAFSCASQPEEPQSKAHNATLVNDIFSIDQGMPVREIKRQQDFFFKKCTLEERRPFGTGPEYSCTSL